MNVVVEFYGYEDKVINLKNSLSEGGSGLYIWLATLFLAGFTPLPFKVFTITSGMIGFNFLYFFICLISRGLRFFIVSYLSFKFGDTFSKFMKTDAAKWFTILGILIVLIFGLIYFIIK